MRTCKIEFKDSHKTFDNLLAINSYYFHIWKEFQSIDYDTVKVIFKVELNAI